MILLASDRPVTLIGGGPAPADLLARALAIAPVAVGADGGAETPLPGGARVVAAIGDLDSVRDPEGLRARGVAVHELAEQDTTDLEKCLYSVAAPLTLGVGFLGGRVDHHLAALNALARAAPRPVILLGAEDLVFACPRTLALDLAPGARVSFFPLAPVTGLVSEGLRWPVKGLAFAPGGRIGTSNAATGGRMRAGFDGPGMLAILPLDQLEAVAAGLEGRG